MVGLTGDTCVIVGCVNVVWLLPALWPLMGGCLSFPCCDWWCTAQPHPVDDTFNTHLATVEYEVIVEDEIVMGDILGWKEGV